MTEFESTATVIITDKEANDLSHRIVDAIMREYPKLDDELLLSIATSTLTDYEFEQDVTVEIEPSDRDEP